MEGTLQLWDTAFPVGSKRVSILVLVEGTLQLNGVSTISRVPICFNPCFSGRYSAIGQIFPIFSE